MYCQVIRQRRGVEERCQAFLFTRVLQGGEEELGMPLAPAQFIQATISRDTQEPGFERSLAPSHGLFAPQDRQEAKQLDPEELHYIVSLAAVQPGEGRLLCLVQ